MTTQNVLRAKRWCQIINTQQASHYVLHKLTHTYKFSVLVSCPTSCEILQDANDLLETSYVYIYIHLHQFFNTHKLTHIHTNTHAVVPMSLDTCSHEPYTVNQNTHKLTHTHTHTHKHTRCSTHVIRHVFS